MATYKETHEGCEIEIEDDERLTINGKHIEHEQLPPTGTWSSRYLPYTTYDSLAELGRAIVSNTSEFKN